MDNEYLATLLERVRTILVSGWCQIDAAQNSDGEHVKPTDSRACRWCIVGAVDLASRGAVTHHAAVMRALYAALPREAQLIGNCNDAVPFWNDTRGRLHAEVIALVDRARAMVPA